MDQLEAIETPSLVVTAGDITLIEGAARDLHDLGEEPTTHGHRPSWAYSQIPDGLALCVGCWRPIAAQQLGGERCPGPRKPQA
jgi:hypothetical protein